jgi:hypothetical protein
MNPLRMIATCLPLLLAAPALAAPGLAAVGGKVLDEKTHQPPAMSDGIWVQAYEVGHSSPADAAPVEGDGRYTLLVEPGEYAIRVTRNGVVIRRDELKVTDAPVSLDFLVPGQAHRELASKARRTAPSRPSSRT